MQKCKKKRLAIFLHTCLCHLDLLSQLRDFPSSVAGSSGAALITGVSPPPLLYATGPQSLVAPCPVNKQTARTCASDPHIFSVTANSVTSDQRKGNNYQRLVQIFRMSWQHLALLTLDQIAQVRICEGVNFWWLSGFCGQTFLCGTAAPNVWRPHLMCGVPSQTVRVCATLWGLCGLW